LKRSRIRWIVVGLGVLVVGAVVFRTLTEPAERVEYCSARVDGTYVQLDLEQARYASMIAATGHRRGMPARATSIAIATAYQESKVRNITYGDRDSIGLFQQRPSQGWGTRQQIMDPHYAIGKFFDALAEVDGYRTMEITKAAQKVQRSAYGDAYAQHEKYARALASALTGNSPATFSCQIRTPEREELGDSGSQDSSTQVRAEVRRAFGRIDHERLDRAVAYRPAGAREGWALAHYAVANAKRLGIDSVSYDGRRWTAEDSPRGWITSQSSSQHVRVGLG